MSSNKKQSRSSWTKPQVTSFWLRGAHGPGWGTAHPDHPPQPPTPHAAAPAQTPPRRPLTHRRDSPPRRAVARYRPRGEPGDEAKRPPPVSPHCPARYRPPPPPPLRPPPQPQRDSRPAHAQRPWLARPAAGWGWRSGGGGRRGPRSTRQPQRNRPRRAPQLPAALSSPLLSPPPGPPPPAAERKGRAAARGERGGG